MKKFGLIGKNINYSFSPILHSIIFKTLNLNCSYTIFDSEEKELPELINNLKNYKINGFNITVPYKEKIIKYIDTLSENARNIGAVNTIYLKNGKVIGDNTDFYGFEQTLLNMNIDISNKNVVVLGTGGASKAVIEVLKKFTSNIFIVSRNPENIKNKNLNYLYMNYNKLLQVKGELIINCTPLGGSNYKNISPITEDISKNFLSAIDLNYTPELSPFLLFFKNQNKKYKNGLFMLVAQGIQAQKIWQDINISIDSIYNKVYNTVYKK